MKKISGLIIIGVIVAGGAWYYLAFRAKPVQRAMVSPPSADQIIPERTAMRITSSAFGHNQNIPPKYTCDGENVNPPLQFQDVSPSASSLVLIVDDPDAPRGDWVHWLVWNIPPGVASIAENSVPSLAVQGTTDFGSQKYGGPCPPSGTHRYFFKLYALDTMLDLPPSAVKKDLEAAIRNHIIEQAELIGLYKRQRQ